MKLILIGVILGVILVCSAFFAGSQYKQRSNDFIDLKTNIHQEHTELGSKMDNMNDKLESMNTKLDVLIKIATKPVGHDFSR